MKIKLVQSGGLVPVNKEAEMEVGWTKEECDHLLAGIRAGGGAASPVRDGLAYTLEANGKEVEVNLDKVPAKYTAVFDQLRKNLQFVKN